MKIFLGVLLTVGLMSGAERNSRPRWRTILYRSSIVAVTAANAFDIGSSWGGRELTPMLRSRDGRFGARGTGIKLGMLAGILTTEHYFVRKHPESDLAASTVNLAMAAMMSRIAARNVTVSSERK
ncbi:MAG TPA: hypothetical protein VMZ52_11850 [Bryobacteraceae bacterium]|nr:hypothetical protein [Bryobacteraceae bacterium]